MHPISIISKKKKKLAIGLMSGTSVDGIDAVLVEITGSGLNTQLSQRGFTTFPIPAPVRDEILRCSEADGGTTESLCLLNVVLGELFAKAAFGVLEAAGVQASEVDFIGSHGQTVHHIPQERSHLGFNVSGTLQIGEPSVIAKRTGILTVADFRPADMALGGQGAPLVPYFDFLLFRSEKVGRILVNIGGIANVTILPKNCDADAVSAFDTGPGNMIIDYLVKALFNKPFDENGELARQGECSEELLGSAMATPFLKMRPPKTTGREAFGARFANDFLRRGRTLRLEPHSIVATATELTARSIWFNYEHHIAAQTEVDQILVSGGGASNSFLMSRLQSLAGDLPIRRLDSAGISADAKEALCFAVLANETMCGKPANIPSATGAQSRTILGKICL